MLDLCIRTFGDIIFCSKKFCSTELLAKQNRVVKLYHKLESS